MERCFGIRDDPERQSNWYYIGCFFVTIASVLGTGILGLPVKTANSGFFPFLVIFLIVLIFEVGVIIYFVELLQQSRAIMRLGIGSLDELKAREQLELAKPADGFSVREEASGKRGSASYKPLPYEKDQLYSSEKSVVNEENSDNPASVQEIDLNLHSMGRLFLNVWLRYIFDLCVFLHFLAILISYVLAGSEAWGGVFGLEGGCKAHPSSEDERNLRFIIVTFGVGFTVCVVFGQRLFTSVVSLMTAVKGSLLVLMVAVTAYVGLDIMESIDSDWSHIAESFLMSTVALGGAINLMPLVFNKVPQRTGEVRKFRWAVSVGLCVCSVLIVLWTLFVMLAVPQTGPAPSLEEAADKGCISTIPLTEVIRDTQPDLEWIAKIVEVFIVVSISISFITVGSGLKNFLDGYAFTFSSKIQASAENGSGLAMKITGFFDNVQARSLHLSWFSVETGLKIVLYLISFGLSIGFAVGKPACFLVMLEYFASFALNLEAGLFIALMAVVSSRYGRNLSSYIPLPLPQPFASRFAYVLGSFFLAAVVYDVVDVIRKFVDKGGLC